ncbi:endo-1,4-beta-xylanase [Halarchaeum nitratireducens]|uniref:endo-1,4-beta-xylanase n=1 Tax=Halarchaeum nitratireducens TaxID=489913 RepID=A0A830G8P0_9EURY|nr:MULTISPECIES: endo-1,4-beta-xylanase [Halarchaeum]MBP2249796.1 GH35 family endo-1,4-beta-xylanase [Halarchaeum solikamskense]GGN10552.1 beta-xylanase [Halarchaeum nitratireducens]
MDRRHFLAAALAPLAGCANVDDAETSTSRTDTTAVDDSAFEPVPEGDWERADAPPEWERAADRRIDRHRRGDVTVAVSRDGDPVPDADVRLRLRRHAYDFSTAYNVARHWSSDPDGPYRRWVSRLFNEAVFENAYKWRQWTAPDGHQRTHGVITFLRANDVAVAGAPVVWQNHEKDVLPDEVWSAYENGDIDRLRELIDDHVRTLVGHNAGDHGVEDWVLLNEQLGFHDFTDALADAPPTRSPPLRHWFDIARDAAPDATLAVNDYDILTLDRPEHRDRYADLVTYLLGGAAPPDEVAFQSHVTTPDGSIGPAEQYARLDRFAGLGDIDLVVSEFDTPGIADETAAGDYLYRTLKTVYSHPASAGFRLWGYWDDQHWRGDAPLFRADWSKKPGYHAYVDLVFDQWFTDVRGTTDATGEFSTTADLGRYDLRVAADPETVSDVRAMTDPDGETRLRVEL